MPEDPAVAVVEQLFDERRHPAESSPSEEGRALVEHALWICACVTLDAAPRWLICDTAAGGFWWRRVPVGVDLLDLVTARYAAGGHADPAEVLRWLRGEATDPWARGGDGSGDPGVLEALRRRINGE